MIVLPDTEDCTIIYYIFIRLDKTLERDGQTDIIGGHRTAVRTRCKNANPIAIYYRYFTNKPPMSVLILTVKPGQHSSRVERATCTRSQCRSTSTQTDARSHRDPAGSNSYRNTHYLTPSPAQLGSTTAVPSTS